MPQKCTCHIINTMSSMPFLFSELHNYDIPTKALNCLMFKLPWHLTAWMFVCTLLQENHENQVSALINTWNFDPSSTSNAWPSRCLQMTYHMLSAMPVTITTPGAVLMVNSHCWLRDRAFVYCLGIWNIYIPRQYVKNIFVRCHINLDLI